MVRVEYFNNATSKYTLIDNSDFISGNIDFGDATSSVYSHNTYFDHTYLTTGPKSITYTTVFKDNNGNNVTKICNLEFNVSAKSCYIPSEFCYPDNKRTSPSNDWFMWYSAWANKIGTDPTVHEYRMGSYTVGWKLKNNGRWVRRCTRLETKITGDEKNGSCLNAGNNINIWKNSFFFRRKLSKRSKETAISFQYGNYHSYHALTNHGNSVHETFQPICD